MSCRPNLSEKLFAACAPILLILVCWQPLKASSDLWAHAAVGRWIVQHGEIPHSALFLWSYSGHWTAHSWLSEIGTYELMQLGGDLGGPVLMVVFASIVAVVAFAFAMWPVVKNRQLPIAPAMVFLSALTAATPRFAPRPELFTTLFTAILCATLVRPVAESAIGQFKRFLWLPLLFILWTNLHGAVIFGLAILWLTAACDFVQRDKRSRGTALVGISVLCTLSMLVNPSGLGYLDAYAPLANQSFSTIDEWKPFWSPPQAPLTIPVAELILFVSAVGAWWIGGRKRLAELAWIVLATLAFVGARRNMDLMALICVVVFCKNYELVLSSELIKHVREQINGERLLRISTSVTTAYFIYLLGICSYCVISTPFVESTVASIPIEQARAIDEICPNGTRVLNLYDSAAYFEWKLGERKTFIIDGMNAYPNSVYDDWVQIWNATPRGITLLNSDRVGCIAGGPIIANTVMPPLYTYLAGNKSWRLVYSGSDGPVFARVTPAVIEKRNNLGLSSITRKPVNAIATYVDPNIAPTLKRYAAVGY